MTKKEAIDVLENLQAQMDYSEYDALDMAIEALKADVRCLGFETQEIVVKGGKNHDFESCDKCKYWELEPEICKLMGCIHAWDEMRDCYKEEER